MLTNVLILAGIAILVLPLMKHAANKVPALGGGKGPTFLQATSDLASVRHRLVCTGSLKEAEKAAIDTLQLALTSSSDLED